MTFAALAKAAALPVDVTATYYQKKYTYSYGTACVHVAVDAGTGHVEILDLLTIKDCGRMINPLTLKGQGIGSMVQGLGGAFLEELVYDAQGQLLLQSHGFDAPKDAAQAISLLQTQGAAALPALQARLQALAGVTPTAVDSALQQLMAARR